MLINKEKERKHTKDEYLEKKNNNNIINILNKSKEKTASNEPMRCNNLFSKKRSLAFGIKEINQPSTSLSKVTKKFELKEININKVIKKFESKEKNLATNPKKSSLFTSSTLCDSSDDGTKKYYGVNRKPLFLKQQQELDNQQEAKRKEKRTGTWWEGQGGQIPLEAL
jgi:hypothetical protein